MVLKAASVQTSTEGRVNWRNIAITLIDRVAGNDTRRLTLPLPAPQNPPQEGGIVRNKLFVILGLLLTPPFTAYAQTKADVKQQFPMAHQHSPRFLQIVNESRKRVRETNVDEVKRDWIEAKNLSSSMCARGASFPRTICRGQFISARE
jgi:hypothetical protein